MAEQRVDDVAGLFLVQLDRNHADVLGECDDLLVHARIGFKRTHHLGNVVDPDVVGEVQRQKTIRATSRIHYVAGK
jgi:hypothetical protein